MSDSLFERIGGNAAVALFLRKVLLNIEFVYFNRPYFAG